MPSRSPGTLIDERVAQLEAISERRNVLLREMYHMIRQQQNVGSILTFDEGDEGDLHVFLQRFDLSKNPESGAIATLPESELFSSPPSTHHAALTMVSATSSCSKAQSVADVNSPESEHTANKADEVDSDDILSFALPEGESSVPQSISLPPHIYQEDDDEPDELDLIGSLSPSPSPRSETSYEPHTQSASQRSRSRSTVIHGLTKDVSPVALEKERNTEHEERPLKTETPGLEDTELMSLDSTVPETVCSPRSVVPFVPVVPVHVPEEEPKTEYKEQPLSTTPSLEESKLMPLTSEIPSVRQHLPQAPFVPSVAVHSPLSKRWTMIPTPSSPIVTPVYDFHESSLTSPQPPTSPISATQPPHHFNPQYTLPSLKALPAEFNRKGKPTKQHRKREKEREKIEKGFAKGDGKKEKEEWVPMGVNKWNATVRANPVWRRVARASKCLSTREWSVAMTELRFVRALDRIESLEEAGRWSLRQPKKQRGIGGLTKSHWDYLMEEMKWMRIDFREERKWKMALAYNLATAVLEWHAAGSLAERVARKICVLWKRPKPEVVSEMDEDVAGPPDDIVVDDTPAREVKSNPLAMVDYGSEDEDEDEADKSVVDALEPIALVQDALDVADQTIKSEKDQMQVDGVELVEPKVEDVDPQVVDDSSGEPSTISKPTLKPNVYAPLREWIAYSADDKLFLDLDDAAFIQEDYAPSTEDDLLKPDVLPPPDLSTIFPDLPPFGILDIAPSMLGGAPTEGKKKSEKRSDKDDPNKRAEDITYTKLAPTGQFMRCKPTLLGPLQPARFWKNGRWLNLDESMGISESDSPLTKMVDENMCELFEGSKPGNSPAVGTYMLPQGPDARKRADHLWTTDDDTLLKRLVEKYPNNWPLICDAFNSSRVTISTDKRTPWDCLERWDSRWGGSRLVPHTSPADSLEGTPTLSTSVQMTTRGVKRLAGSTTSAQSTGIGSSEPKRRRRHILMLETIRKVAKKREASQKSNANQRKSTAIHDTHNQYNKMPKLTPAELSRMKADKDASNQDIILAKRRHEEIVRQSLLRDQAHRMQVQPNAQQGQTLQPQQQQQQATGVPRPAGAGIATQGVPQIRSQQVNISQQQRIPTPMAGANTRMSPQQIIHAQAQAAQARAMAAAQAAQAQTQNGQANLNGMNNTHLSPTYTSRAATSSPAQSSPPRSSSTPSNVINPPRPPSAQSQVMVPAPGNALPRPPHYFPGQNLQAPQFTQEQMEQALRLQTLMAQHRAGMSQGQNGSYPSQS